MSGINITFGEEEIKEMNKRLQLRGTKSKYVQLHDRLYLGHVWLPTKNLSIWDDPPVRHDNLLGAIVGAIYNYKELSPGACSDLKVILEGYAKMGPEIFQHVDGDYSVIIKDITKDTLNIYTDPLATKPLYIRKMPFGISSEIKPLQNLAETTLDMIYFSAIAKWGFCLDTRTPFNEIFKIPPGCHFNIDLKTGGIGATEHIKLKPQKTDIAEALRQSVKHRLVSDAPVALLLSGGLSSTILYYLLRKMTDELAIFHVENDEEEYLNYINFRPQDKIKKLVLDQNKACLKSALYDNEGPADMGAMIPISLLAQELGRQGYPVCLSGHGADALFGHHQRADIFYQMVYHDLPQLDKFMANHKIELRMPFLANQVIEGALAMDYDQRVNREGLRQAFAKDIPIGIYNREKQTLQPYSDHTSQTLIQMYKDLYK